MHSPSPRKGEEGWLQHPPSPTPWPSIPGVEKQFASRKNRDGKRRKRDRASNYSHLVESFVQPDTWEVESLLRSYVPVAAKVFIIDEYNPLHPALEIKQGRSCFTTRAPKVKPHQKQTQ